MLVKIMKGRIKMNLGTVNKLNEQVAKNVFPSTKKRRLSTDRSGAETRRGFLMQQSKKQTSELFHLIIYSSLIYARYNIYHNSINITTFDRYILWIDCNKAEEGLEATAWTDYVLNTMAIDNLPEYACLALDGNLQMWVDAEAGLALW